MYQEAVSKLKTEIEQSKNNPYVQVVGNFLLDHLERNHQYAENIMTTDKTITKSLDEMQKVAAKKKVGNYAVLTDQEGFGIVLKYFGIDSATTISVPTADQKSKSKVDFDISLDDLLG